MHHQARLHAHGRSVAAVDALDLAGQQAVADVVHAGAAVVVEGRAEKPEGPHLLEYLGIEDLLAVGLEDARHELVLAVLSCRVTHHALLLVEQSVELQRVLPVEGGHCA